MRLSKNEEVHKEKIELDVRASYRNEINHLRALNFTEEYYVRSTSFPFSGALLFPFVAAMWLSGEQVRIGGWLQAITFNPFLIHEDGYAFATVMKMGVKFVSMFDDQTMLSTVTYTNGGMSKPQFGYIRQECITPHLSVVWQQHAERVKELSDEGRSVIAPLGMKDIDRMEERSDKILLGFVPDDFKEKNKTKRSSSL